jgi:membrane-bound metal-dependent hydrolase YbcI (DUF457 family)
MFAGHIGAGLALGSRARELNVGLFIAAALLLDVLLWLFVLLGWESVAIPGDFASRHQAAFVFPYSHGLVASLIWSTIAAAAALMFRSGVRRARAAALVAAAVLSHWLLDALVHRPELPLSGLNSPAVGLALWDHMALALAVESALVLVGGYMFIAGARAGRNRSIALLVLSVVVMIFTAIGMTVAPAPPSSTAMAVSSLATLAAVSSLALWLGRVPAAT